MASSAGGPGGWLLKQRANIKTWRRFWAEISLKGGGVTLRFASSPEAAAQSAFEKDVDVTGYVLRGDSSKAGYYFECYKGSNKLHFFRAEDAVASRVWMAKLVAAGLTRGPSLDQANDARTFDFHCWKRGGGTKSSAWRRRWLRLFDKELKYWTSDTDDSPPKGCFNVVQSLLVLDAAPDTTTIPLHVIRVCVIGREYVFGFEQEGERERFLRALELYGGNVDAHAEQTIARAGASVESARDVMLRNSVAIGGGRDDDYVTDVARAVNGGAAELPQRLSTVQGIMEGAPTIQDLHARFKCITDSSSAATITCLAADFNAAAEALPATSANAIFARSRQQELLARLQATGVE